MVGRGGKHDGLLPRAYVQIRVPAKHLQRSVKQRLKVAAREVRADRGKPVLCAASASVDSVRLVGVLRDVPHQDDAVTVVRRDSGQRAHPDRDPVPPGQVADHAGQFITDPDPGQHDPHLTAFTTVFAIQRLLNQRRGLRQRAGP